MTGVSGVVPGMELPVELWTRLRAIEAAGPPATNAPIGTSAATLPPADQGAGGGRAEPAGLIRAALGQDLFPLLMASDAGPAVERAKPGYRALDHAFRKRYALSREAVQMLLQIVDPQDFLFYKGADHRHRLYGLPHWRPMADIDIFVPRSRLARVKDSLARAGLRPGHAAFGAVFLPGYHETRYDLPGSALDVHTSFGQRIRSGIDYAALWEGREWFEADGVRGQRLGHADAIVVQAFNLAKDEFASALSRHLDFCLLVHARPDLLNACVARAKAWRVERALFGALHISASLFPSWSCLQLQSAMQQLLDPAQRAELVERVLPRWPADLPGQPIGRRLQLRRKFSLIDQPWRRLAFVGYHAYASSVGSVLGLPTRLRRYRLDRRS